jgi:hypothetical protein
MPADCRLKRRSAEIAALGSREDLKQEIKQGIKSLPKDSPHTGQEANTVPSARTDPLASLNR